MSRLWSLNLFPFLLFLFFGSAVSINAQLTVTTTPSLMNDTAFVCVPNSTVSFTANYMPPPDSIVWTFSNGMPQRATGSGAKLVNWTAIGTHGARVRVYNGGVIDTSYSIWVNLQQLGPVSFNPSKTVFCQSDSRFNLNGFSPPGGYFRGPGISGNRFDPDGIGAGNKIIWYIVEKGGCKDSASVTMNVKAAPSTTLNSTGTLTTFQGLNVYSLCPPSTPNFFFSSPTPSSQYDSFELDYGDGSPLLTGTVFPSPVSHAFPVGLYTVSLKMTNTTTGCSRIKQVNVFNGSNPAGGIFTFGNNSACLPYDTSTVGFYFGISGAINNPPGTVYIVQFNDGSPAITLQHPPPDSVFHRFSSTSCGVNFGSTTNSFGANISIISPCGATYGSVSPIYISRAPQADFGLEKQVCVNTPISIYDSSFGGHYASSFTANCSQPAKVIWSISPQTFTLNSGTFGTRIVNGDPAQWIEGSKTLNVTFHKTGIYTVKQVVGNSIACRIDSLEQTICIDSLPIASLRLSGDTVCVGDSITAIFDEDIVGICDTIEIRWGRSQGPHCELGLTGIFDTTQNYIFNRVGVYPIRMVAENTCDSIELWDTVVVQGGPTAIFPSDTAICGLAQVDFSALHLQPEVYDSLASVSYLWSVSPATGWTFTGGTSPSSVSPVLDFTQHGNFQVYLTVSNACGSYTDTMEVSLTEKPVLAALGLAFVDTVVCTGTSLGYKATASLGALPYQFEWGSWSQGVLGTTDSIFISNLVSDTSLFVKVTDGLGCSDSIGFRVLVMPSPTVDAGNYPGLCYTDSVVLNATVAGGVGPFTYSWNPAAGLSDTTILNPVRSPLDSSITYTFSVRDSLGCVYSDTVTVTVFPQPNFSGGSNFTICINQGDTTLTGATPAGGSWTGVGITGSVFSPATAGIGMYTLTYLYTDPNNCFYSDTITATVIQQPNPDFGMDVTQACSPLTISFTDSSGAASGHQWFMNGIPFSTAANPVQTFINQFPDRDTVIRIKLLFQAGSGCSDSIVKTVTVFPRPQANFMLPASTCAGDSLQVVNTSIFKGASPTFRWSASSSLVLISDTTAGNPSFTFPDFNSGTDSLYSICLIVISTDGCSDTICQNILIHSRPKADFSLPSKSCTPVSIVPTDQSAGQGLNYQWSVTPAANVTLAGGNTAMPNLHFTTPAQDSASYFINLFISDANGCVDSIQKNYTVYAQPVAAFSASQTDSCGPLTVVFTDSSYSGLSGTGQGLTYLWDLGNGQTASTADTSATYFNTGVKDTTYFVSLIVQNSLGCSDTILDSITVHPDPRAEMLLVDSVDCAPFTLDTTVVKALQFPGANSNYTWRVLDRNRAFVQQFNGLSFSHAMSGGGDTVFLQLIASSPFGCKADTVEQRFYTIVNPQPNFAAIPDTICSGGTVAFYDSSSSGVSHEWFINSQLFSTLKNPQLNLINLTNTSDSLVTIKLRIKAGSSGCSDSVSKPVVIKPAPLAQFTLPVRLCANDSVQAVNSSVPDNGVVYRWKVLSGAATVSDSTGLQPWFYFPDNQSGFDSTYTFQLIVSNSFGCADTATKGITINSRPVAAFTLPGNGCGPFMLTPASVAMGQGLSYSWGIAPSTGVTMSAPNTAAPGFAFISPPQDSASYRIQLTITDANGCMDTLSRLFSVYPKPSAVFTPSNTDSCGPLTVSFANTSDPHINGQNLGDMTFSWEFGNGQTSQDSTPAMTFTNIGVHDSVYIVQLISTNSLGCSDTAFDSITVRPNPFAELDTTTTFGCTPFGIDSTVVKAWRYPNANSGYQWTILDPGTQVVLNTFNGYDAVNFVMTTPGDSVLVRLVTPGLFGCKSDTVEQIFRTIPNPEPGFVIDSTAGCHPLTINITDTSSPGLSYQWYINGQLQATTLPNPSFILTNPSTTSDAVYKIKLLGTAGSTGCVDSIADSVTVYALPDPSFLASEVCGGDTTAFTNTTLSLDTIVQWNWDFGDNTTSALKSPVHAYTSFGSYGVALTATDGRGCSQTYLDTIVVRPNPVADFSSTKSCGPDTACLNRPFSFTDLSAVAALGGNIVAWEWDILNDGTVDFTIQNPQYTFVQTGVFSVKLRVQTQYGCSDTIVRQILVLDPLSANFVTDTTATCGPLNIVATDSSTGPITNYFWELYSLDGSNNKTTIYTSGQQNPGTIPTLQPGYVNDTTYVLKLTVSNCCDTVSHQQSFTLSPLPAAGMVVLPASGCSGFQATFTIDGHTTGRPDSIILNYGDGTKVTLVPSPVYYLGDTLYFVGQQVHTFLNLTNKDTIYTVTLKAVNDCGDSTIMAPVLVHPNIVQATFTYTPQQGCEDLTVTFRDSSSFGTTVAWYFDYDSISGSGQNTAVGRVVTHTYTDPGTYKVVQIVDDGCSFDTATTTITVWDAPDPAFTYNNFICEDDTTIFINQSQANVGTISLYQWFFGDGNSSTQKDPVHIYDTAGVFTVWMVASSTNGCKDSISHQVTIYDKPEIDFGYQHACLNQQPIFFSDSTTIQFGTVTGTVWNFGDGNTSTLKNPQHTYASPGTYVVTLHKTSSNGCVDSASHAVQIFPIPKAGFSSTRPGVDSCGTPQTFQFNNLSTGAQGFYWDFNYGIAPGTDTSNTTNPTFTYTQPGVYKVMLIAANGFGCTDTLVRTLMVRPFPKAGFTADTVEGCIPFTVTFTDTSTYSFNGPGGIQQWHWDFGDGATATGGAVVSHRYQVDGAYSVKLRVETDGGCSDSVTYSQFIQAHFTPEVSFSIAKENSRTYVFGNGTIFKDPNTQFYWTFGDGGFSYEKMPTHIYNIDLFETDYNFTICLTATNSFGCDSTLCQDIEITGYQLSVPNAFAPDQDGVGDGNVFLPKGHALIEYELKIFDEWGNTVFRSTSVDEFGRPDEPWDGTLNGMDLPMGGYVWKIVAKFNDGTDWPGKQYSNNVRMHHGTITLIR